MTLHNKPEYNSPEIRRRLVAHGMNPDEPDMLADAFRLGFLSNTPDWEPQRCAECDCEFGQASCNWIKSRTIEQPHMEGHSNE